MSIYLRKYESDTGSRFKLKEVLLTVRYENISIFPYIVSCDQLSAACIQD